MAEDTTPKAEAPKPKAPVTTQTPADVEKTNVTNAAGPAVEPEEETEAPRPDRLTLLKQRADNMGLTYSNNIGVDALAQKIQDRLNGVKDTPNTPAAEEELSDRQKELQAKRKLRQDATRLVRLRIANLNPDKADLPGEILTVSNSVIGTVRKYIPFGEVTDEGWHVPNVLYQVMKDRTFLQIRTIKDPVTKQERNVENWVKEFALEELPPLTQEELDALAVRQAAAVGL